MSSFNLTTEKLRAMYTEALFVWSKVIPEEHYILATRYKWVPELSKTPVKAGECDYSAKVIRVSAVFAAEVGEQETMNTVLHETLHIFFPKAGHKNEWQNYARIFNTDPAMASYREQYGCIKRTYTSDKKVTYLYSIYCNSCSTLVDRLQRRGKSIGIIQNCKLKKKKSPYYCGICKSHDLEVIKH